MEELKIGDYIRTKKGKIAQVKTISEAKYTYHTARARNRMKYIGKKRTLINGRYEIEDIAKCKTNIEELLEVGDLVEYILHTGLEDLHCIKIIDINFLENINNKDLEILSITNNEQFNSTKYFVEE